MIPSSETIFVIIPPASALTRHLNLSVHRSWGGISTLPDGRLLLEVPSVHSAEFLDFEWLDADEARQLLSPSGSEEVASLWSRFRSKLRRTPGLEPATDPTEEIA